MNLFVIKNSTARVEILYGCSAVWINELDWFIINNSFAI